MAPLVDDALYNRYIYFTLITMIDILNICCISVFHYLQSHIRLEYSFSTLIYQLQEYGDW